MNVTVMHFTSGNNLVGTFDQTCEIVKDFLMPLKMRLVAAAVHPYIHAENNTAHLIVFGFKSYKLRPVYFFLRFSKTSAIFTDEQSLIRPATTPTGIAAPSLKFIQPFWNLALGSSFSNF